MEHDERDAALQNVLLVLEASIDGYQDVKAGLAGRPEEGPILHASPAHRLNSGDVDADEVLEEIVRKRFVREYPRSRRRCVSWRRGQAATSASKASRASPSAA